MAGQGSPVPQAREPCASAKTIVATAKGTGRGIAVEDLGGIRDRLPAWGRDARNRLSGWSFAQLVAFLSYKARLAGVPVVTVDPRNTSRTVRACGHCEKANRKSQERFLCVSCGHRAERGPKRRPEHQGSGTSKRALELATDEAKTGNGTAAEVRRKSPGFSRWEA